MKASIIIPVYNAAATLEATVRTVLAQSESDFELILVDDCSTDASPAVCKALAAEDARVRYLRNAKNSGPAATRNAGIRAAQGEWLLFVDSDDFVASDYLKCLTSYEDADIVWCNFHYLYTASDRSEPTDHGHRGLLDEKAFLMCYATNSTGCGSMWNKAYRRDFILRNNLLINEGRVYGEDWDFNFRAAQCSPRVVAIEDDLYTYIKAPVKSVSGRYYRQDFDSYCESDGRLEEVIRQYELPVEIAPLKNRVVYNIVSLLYKLCHSDLQPQEKAQEYRKIYTEPKFRRALNASDWRNPHLTARQTLTAALLRLHLHRLAWLTLKI